MLASYKLLIKATCIYIIKLLLVTHLYVNRRYGIYTSVLVRESHTMSYAAPRIRQPLHPDVCSPLIQHLQRLFHRVPRSIDLKKKNRQEIVIFRFLNKRESDAELCELPVSGKRLLAKCELPVSAKRLLAKCELPVSGKRSSPRLSCLTRITMELREVRRRLLAFRNREMSSSRLFTMIRAARLNTFENIVFKMLLGIILEIISRHK